MLEFGTTLEVLIWPATPNLQAILGPPKEAFLAIKIKSYGTQIRKDIIICGFGSGRILIGYVDLVRFTEKFRFRA